jgi:RimJ/RimL family protein N-acetyltransferase
MTILESPRLLFREHEPRDLEPYCAMEMDPEVRRYVGGYPRAREDAERKFRDGPLQPVDNRLAMWATVLKPENRYIGRCGLYPHFGTNGIAPGEATLAFYIARDYWGRGLATEAGRAFVRFGFEELHLTRIVTTVQLGNDASVRVLEKLGFGLTATEVGPRSFLKFELVSPWPHMADQP